MLFVYEKNGYSWAGSDKPYKSPYQVDADILSFEPETASLYQQVCKNLPTAESYIQQQADEFGWRPELIKGAKTYSVSALPLPVKYFEPFWCCYENCFLQAKATGLKYVEGIVVTPTGVFVHAWNSNGDDVLDYTYPQQHLNSYFGIEFSIEMIAKLWPIAGGLLGYLHEEVKAKKPNFAHRLLYG